MSKKRPDHIPPYIKLRYDMLEHPAFETLSSGAFKLVIYVRKRFNGRNNGQIAFSVREAAGLLRCSKDTAGRYFKELVDHRLLEPIVKGDFDWKVKHATTWRVTFEHMNGRAGTNDFTHFKPAPDGPTTRTEPTGPNLKHGPITGPNGPTRGTARSDQRDKPHPHGPTRGTITA